MTATSLLAAPIARHTLDNGLRVCVVSDPQSPIVAINVGYHVGAVHEAPNMNGFAHLFEHLMFAGSQNVRAGELSATLGGVGAAPNAFTDFDLTSYFVTVPKGALEMALWLEADRMGGMLAALDQRMLDNEREIVRNERRQTMETVPFGLLWDRLHRELFPDGHPYHWIPMGSMEELAAADLDVVREFFTSHYGPNNAVLAIVGDVTPEEGFALAEKYFGGLARNESIVARRTATFEPLESEKTIEMDEPMPVACAVAAYRIPPRGDADWPALHLAGRILSDGEASRLGERLMLQESAIQDVMATTNDFAGGTDTFNIGLWLNEGADLEHCREVRDEELARLASTPPEAEEVERALANAERELFTRIGTRGGLAELLIREELRNPGADPLEGYLAMLRDVTPQQISEAVGRWLTPNRRVELKYHAPEGEFPFDEMTEDMIEEPLHG